jgi:hypothetical protein
MLSSLSEIFLPDFHFLLLGDGAGYELQIVWYIPEKLRRE